MTNAPSGARIAVAILHRELIRFTRQPARIVAAVGTPALLWLFISSGVGESFAPRSLEETSYAAFLLPGIMTLVAVFAAIFSSISVIEDRNAGWLQSVLVSPAPRWSIALGKTIGGGLLAWIQAAVLLPLAPLAGISLGAGDVAVTLAALALTSFAMAALGLAFAWRSETTAGFHAVMNLVFLPMWLLSGAFFPPDGAAGWLATVMRLNPLTWCTQAIRGPMLDAAWGPGLGVAAAFALVMIGITTLIIGRR